MDLCSRPEASRNPERVTVGTNRVQPLHCSRRGDIRKEFGRNIGSGRIRSLVDLRRRHNIDHAGRSLQTKLDVCRRASR